MNETSTQIRRTGSRTLRMFTMGLRHGFPICLGYFAVAFALGIAAKQANLSAAFSGVSGFWQRMCTSDANMPQHMPTNSACRMTC